MNDVKVTLGGIPIEGWDVNSKKKTIPIEERTDAGKTVNGRQMVYGVLLGHRTPNEPFAVVDNATGEIELEDGTRTYMEIDGHRLEGFLDVNDSDGPPPP